MKDSILSELNKSLKLGTESDDNYNAEDLPTDELVGIDEGETGSAQSIEDIAEDVATDDILDEGEDDLDAANAVEDLVAVVEHAQNNMQKLSRLEAAALKVTFMQITQGRYKDPASLLPARESHQETEFADLTLARESLAETAKDLIKKAIEQIKLAIKRLGDFVKKLTDKFGFLTRRYQAIYKKAKESTGTPNGRNVNEEEIEGASKRSNVQVATKYLAVDGKVTGRTVIDFIDTFDEIDLRIYQYGRSHFGEKVARDDTDNSTEGLVQNISSQTSNLIKNIAEVSYNKVSHGEGVGENITEFVKAPGEYYFGAEKVSGGLVVPVIGKIDRDGSVDGKTAAVRPATKDEIISGAETAQKTIDTLRRTSSKLAREIRVESLIDRQVLENAFVERSALPKDEIKLLTTFAGKLTRFIGDSNQYFYNFLEATAGYFESSLDSSDAIEG